MAPIAPGTLTARRASFPVNTVPSTVLHRTRSIGPGRPASTPSPPAPFGPRSASTGHRQPPSTTVSHRQAPVGLGRPPAGHRQPRSASVGHRFGPDRIPLALIMEMVSIPTNWNWPIQTEQDSDTHCYCLLWFRPYHWLIKIAIVLRSSQ